MSMDPVERLRRANPVPGTPAAPPIEPLLARRKAARNRTASSILRTLVRVDHIGYFTQCRSRSRCWAQS